MDYHYVMNIMMFDLYRCICCNVDSCMLLSLFHHMYVFLCIFDWVPVMKHWWDIEREIEIGPHVRGGKHWKGNRDRATHTFIVVKHKYEILKHQERASLAKAGTWTNMLPMGSGIMTSTDVYRRKNMHYNTWHCITLFHFISPNFISYHSIMCL